MQIAQAVSPEGGQTVEIALDPVELGKVHSMLHASESGISVQILADRPETIDLMRHNAHLLEAEFKSLGYQDIGFDFSQSRQGMTSEGPDEQSNLSVDPAPQLESVPDRQPNNSGAVPADARLDLRL